MYVISSERSLRASDPGRAITFDGRFDKRVGGRGPMPCADGS